MPDFWTEFDQGFQGHLCVRGDHPACPHFAGMGSGFNPRRLRPEFGELREQAERRGQARREAFETVRRAADGKSKAEIEDLYAAELRARGLRVPGQEVLAAVADRIKGNPLPSVKLAGKGLAQLGKATIGVVRLFRDITRPPTGEQQ
jgi:hypothetical protein